MNIPPMIQAVESLDSAIDMTIDPSDRVELLKASVAVQKVLRKHGVFVGTHNKEPENESNDEQRPS